MVAERRITDIAPRQNVKVYVGPAKLKEVDFVFLTNWNGEVALVRSSSYSVPGAMSIWFIQVSTSGTATKTEDTTWFTVDHSYCPKSITFIYRPNK